MTDQPRRMFFPDPETGELVAAYPVVARRDPISWNASGPTPELTIAAEEWSLLDAMESGVEQFKDADEFAIAAVDEYERAWQATFLSIIAAGGHRVGEQFVKVTATQAEKVAKALHLGLQSEARVAERNAGRAKHVGSVRNEQMRLVQSLARDHRAARGQA